jgi:hypothetical protein
MAHKSEDVVLIRLRHVTTAVVMMLFAFSDAAQTSCSAPAFVPILPLEKTFTSKDAQAVNYENVVDAWLAPASPIKTVTCPNGIDQCLVVPVLADSSSCAVNYGICYSTGGSATERCIATDEMSQFGMALAMARGSAYAVKFAQWYNTLASMRAAGRYTLPPWVVRIVWTSGPTTLAARSTSDSDVNDAVDGTARIALALFIAANNPTFPDADRVRYRRAAIEISLAMRDHDFIAQSRFVRGRTVSNWLAAGWRVAETNGEVYCGQPEELKEECGTVGFAGYYGDVMIALLAAYANTGDVSFRSAVGDIFQNYLYAAHYDGSSFRVPPKEFSWWDTPPAGGEFEALCKDTCAASACSTDGKGQWDSYDAPRAVSVCKAAYYWSRLGTLDDDLETYCEQWVNRPNAITATSYRKVYSWDGNACTSGDQNFYNNGLGAYLNFYCGVSDLETRLASIFSVYDQSKLRFDDNATCMGIYTQTFPVISFGSATGRDLDALTLRPVGLVATGRAADVQLSWSAMAGIAHYEIWRQQPAGAWQLLVPSIATTAYTDTAVSAGTAYLYRVRGVPPSGPATPFSNVDLATVFTFTDDPLIAQTGIKAIHVLQLRSAVDAVRTLAALPPSTYARASITAGATSVAAVDPVELRARLREALEVLGFAAPVYTQAITSTITPVRAADVNEIRSALR